MGCCLYAKYFTSFQLAPLTSNEMVFQRDVKMTLEVLSEEDFNRGILIIGCAHANRMLKWLHQSRSVNVVSIALTPIYPYIIENIPHEIPAFLIDAPGYNHSQSYPIAYNIFCKDPENAFHPTFRSNKLKVAPQVDP